MKKLFIMALLVTMFVLSACAGGAAPAATPPAPAPAPAAPAAPAAPEAAAPAEPENIFINRLHIGFVPSREPEQIITQTAPLGDLLIAELALLGYDVGEVEISVGTTFEAVGQGLSAGTIDIGFIPGGTYVLYDDGAQVILTATRFGLSVDSDDPRVWNDNKPTGLSDEQVTFYRALIISGPSQIGRELADQVNAGIPLTWEDLDRATWGVLGVASPAGYVYPALWLYENFGQSIPHLSNVLPGDSHPTNFARLAAGQIDVLLTFADARRDQEARWQEEFGSEYSIWDETDVIGVTSPIFNDTISVSRNSAVMDEALKAALQQAFINIGNSEAGQEVIAIYNHFGYKIACSSDYDSTRAAQRLIRELTS